eukprot:5464714-Ditylum_brightwellii.AAC.1
MMHAHGVPIANPISCSHNVSLNEKTYVFIANFNTFIIRSTGNPSGSWFEFAFSHASIAIKQWSTSMFVYLAVAVDVNNEVSFSNGEMTSSFFLRFKESLMSK